MRENIVEHLRFCATHFSCSGCGGDCKTGSNEPRTKAVLNDAADAIEELLAAVPHWISVEERLPEKHVEVLICTEDYGKNELGFANTAVWDGSEWIETWNRKESIPYVSHWMPLPEPPKGVE